MKTNFNFISVSAVLLIVLSGCGSISSYKASTNKELDKDEQNIQASFKLRHQRITDNDLDEKCNPKKNKKVLVLLALSGGGSRAALLSGLSMLEMKKKKISINNIESDILSEVDLISSVSGGSLAAAYFASSIDPEQKNSQCDKAISGRSWNNEKVTKLMSKNYILPWVEN